MDERETEEERKFRAYRRMILRDKPVYLAVILLAFVHGRDAAFAGIIAFIVLGVPTAAAIGFWQEQQDITGKKTFDPTWRGAWPYYLGAFAVTHGTAVIFNLVRS
jgi:hypothetical protein